MTKYLTQVFQELKKQLKKPQVLAGIIAQAAQMVFLYYLQRYLNKRLPAPAK